MTCAPATNVDLPVPAYIANCKNRYLATFPAVLILVSSFFRYIRYMAIGFSPSPSRTYLLYQEHIIHIRYLWYIATSFSSSSSRTYNVYISKILIIYIIDQTYLIGPITAISDIGWFHGGSIVVLWLTQGLSTFMLTQRISRHVNIIFNISTKEQWKHKMSIIMWEAAMSYASTFTKEWNILLPSFSCAFGIQMTCAPATNVDLPVPAYIANCKNRYLAMFPAVLIRVARCFILYKRMKHHWVQNAAL